MNNVSGKVSDTTVSAVVNVTQYFSTRASNLERENKSQLQSIASPVKRGDSPVKNNETSYRPLVA